MKLKTKLLSTFLASSIAFAAVVSPAQVQVTVNNLVSGANVTQPYSISASAQSAASISGWKIYIDGSPRWQGPASVNIEAVNVLHHMPSGNHNVTVRAWNVQGEFGSVSLGVHVNNDVAPPERIHAYAPNPNLPFGNPNPAPVTAVVEADDFNGSTEIFIDGVLEFQSLKPYVDTGFNLSPGIHTILFRYRTPANAWILKSYQFCVRSGDPTQEGCTQ